MPNAYGNQAFNGQPKHPSNGFRIIGQPINTIFGTGRVVDIKRAYGGVDSIQAAPLDPWIITVLIDVTNIPVIFYVSSFFFTSGVGPENNMLSEG